MTLSDIEEMISDRAVTTTTMAGPSRGFAASLNIEVVKGSVASAAVGFGPSEHEARLNLVNMLRGAVISFKNPWMQGSRTRLRLPSNITLGD